MAVYYTGNNCTQCPGPGESAMINIAHANPNNDSTDMVGFCVKTGTITTTNPAINIPNIFRLYPCRNMCAPEF